MKNSNPSHNPTKTYKFPFTDRASYIMWRAGWRAAYAELSNTIRETKKEIRETMQNKGYAGMLQTRLIVLKASATEKLEERAASKAEAGRQRQANKIETVTA